MLKGIRKRYIVAFLFLAIVVLFICTREFKEPAEYNTYKTPAGFDEGVLIVKYPENYTCFRFELPGGTKIISDPYCMDEYVRPDIVTVSHPHVDHCDFSMLEKPYELILQEGEFKFGDVKITGVKGRHDNPRASEGTMYNNMYVLEMEGIRIAQLSSQAILPTEEMYDKIGKADILIMQVFNGGSKLSVEECCKIAGRLEAKIIIPAHGNQSLCSEFAQSMGTGVKYEEDGEMVVTRESLDSIKTPEVIVMDN